MTRHGTGLLLASLALLVVGLLVASACASTAPAAAPETRPEDAGNTTLDGPAPSGVGATPVPFIPQVPSTAEPFPKPKRPIYLLDPNFQAGLERVSRVLVVDPDAGRRYHDILTHYSPLVEVSPDGRRMVVADTYWTKVTRGEARDVLSVFDTSQGEWVADEVPAEGRLKYKGFPSGEQFLFFSDDGARLYLMKYGDPDIHRIRLAALDPETLTTVYEGPYPQCGRRVQVLADRWVCASSSGSMDRGFATAIDEVDPKTGAVLSQLLSVENVGVEAVALSSDKKTLYLVGRDASVVVIDLPGRRVVSHERLDPGPGVRLAYDAIALSPDGTRLFLGLDIDQSSGWGQIDTIAVFDTASWERRAAIPFDEPVVHFALSAKGDQLYVVSIDDQSLAIYDTASFEQIALIDGLRGTPVRIIVPVGAVN